MVTIVTGPSRSISTVSASDILASLCFRLTPIRWLAAIARSELQLASGDPAIGVKIAFAGGLNHAWRQRRRRGLAVPAPGSPLCVEIIAQRLLIKARLRPARAVGIRRPEAGAIGSHHLMNQNDAPFGAKPKFEFRVANNDASLARELLADRVNRSCHALQRARHVVADDPAHPRDSDVFVMAGLSLGRGTENRRIELCAF